MRIDITQDKMFMILSSAYPYELEVVTNALTVEIPNAWMLKKLGTVKNTERKFINDQYNMVPIGLWVNVMKVCKESNFAVDLSAEMQSYLQSFEMNFETFRKYVDDLFRGAKTDSGKPFKPYDYQVKAAWMLLRYKKCCGEISTSAGKTLISFIIFKYMIDVCNIEKILYIVPNVDLAVQSAEKYREYENCLKKHTKEWEIGILKGSLTKKQKEKVESCNILFGTFQSLCKKNVEFFMPFGACINDECLDKDTDVLMADGTVKKIKDVVAGERVVTFDTETGEKIINEVDYVYCGLSKGESLYEVELEDGSVLKITGNHKVYTQRGWIRVDELNENDDAIKHLKSYLKFKSIKKVGIASEEVYNLRIKTDVETQHNYFANGCLVSNCHHSSASSIKNILTKCANLQYSLGVTGTFPKDGLYENLVIQSYIGPVVYRFTANELINKEKRGTPVYVLFKNLNWGTEEEKRQMYLLRKFKNEEDISAGSKVLREEQKMVNSSYTRLKYICDLAIQTKKNTLIIFGDVKGGYGKKIYNYINENSDKSVYYIDGNTPPENREWMTEQFENDTTGQSVIVGSLNCCSEGIDYKNMWSIFLVNTSKSERQVRQMIGRGLRLYPGKDKVVLFDFVDDLRYSEDGKHYDNYMYKHYRERKKIYTEQGFPVYEEKIKFESSEPLI